ncbi:MAG: YncE family protein [Candidatus Sulfotelmatobacter sp.]
MPRALVVSSRIFFTLSTLLSIAAMIGCGGPGSETAPSCSNTLGFTVHVGDVNQNGLYSGDDLQGAAYGAQSSGTTPEYCAGEFGSSTDFLKTPYNLSNGWAPAQWTGAWKGSCVNPINDPAGLSWQLDVQPGDPMSTDGGGPVNMLGECVTPAAESFFQLSGSLPTTLTIPGSGLTTTYGYPVLAVSSVKANGVLSEKESFSVASGGTSATFNYPTNSSGSALAPGLYAYILGNWTASGVLTSVAADALAIGTSTTLASPYGVDAINRSTYTEVCVPGGETKKETRIRRERPQVVCPDDGLQQTCGPPPPQCTSSTTSSILPLVTLLNSAELNYSGSNITVGSQPTAVKAYHNASTASGTPGSGTYIRVTQPTLALVANSGSNTVSVVSLYPTTAVTATISVGTQPVAILIDSTGTYAHVANLGSATVSQINLSSHTVSGTVAVGSTPTSLALDPSGTAFWVGGLNYISKVNTSNLSIAVTYPVSGQVTSLSISSGQNDYVYTIISGSTFQGAHAALTQGVPHTDYEMGIGGEVKAGTSGSLPTWLNIGGPLVSASYGNRYIVEGTPSGFAVLDLEVDKVMMQGSTAGPIVGIAVDPQQGTAYATETSTNTLLSIPLPPAQTD